MSAQLPDFSKVRVLIIGDIMLDRYFYGDTSRISPEAPIPVVKMNQKENRLGGAGNVALNIAALGAQAQLMGIVGEDESAKKLSHCLNVANIANKLQIDPQADTITKLRVISQQQQLLRLDFERGFQTEYRHHLLNDFREELQHADIVILSDYGKGTVSHSKEIIEACRQTNVPVYVDPKSNDFDNYYGATLIKPNLKEFRAVVGDFSTNQEIEEKARNLLEKHNIQALLLTRGGEGMTLVQQNAPVLHIPARAREVFDVTGAGDTAISVLAAGVAAGITLDEAVKLSNVASSIVVGKLGAASATVSELQQETHGLSIGGVLTEEQAMIAIHEAQQKGEKVIMTNGCFDILHLGHIQYMERAKQLGDRLIIAVNDDASVSRLKGPKRPINNLQQRMAVLAGLKSVDWVVPFIEDTPERIICKLLPDVLVKGADYKIEEIAGGQCVLANGGDVKTIELVEGCSTTSVIDRMNQDTDNQ